MLKRKPTQYITLSELKFPLPGPWVVVTDAIDPTKITNLRRTFPLRMWSEQIFQGPEDTATSTDGLRRYLKVEPSSIDGLIPFLNKIDEIKEPGHVVGGHGFIRSFKGCPRQALHTDYFSVLEKVKVKGIVQPYSCVVSVEAGSSIYIGTVKIDLPAGSAIIFRGDCVHGGAEYMKDNIRYHLYIDVEEKHVARHGEAVSWYNPRVEAQKIDLPHVV